MTTREGGGDTTGDRGRAGGAGGEIQSNIMWIEREEGRWRGEIRSNIKRIDREEGGRGRGRERATP